MSKVKLNDLKEFSVKALMNAGLTKENAELNNVTLELVLSDLFEKIEGTFDCIICNPPYLNAKEMQEIDSSLRFEPEMALYGGNDGLDFYQRIREVYKQFLNPDGWLIMEIGYSQAEALKALFENAEILNDYGGRPRCLAVKKND